MSVLSLSVNKRRGKEINCFETIVLQQIMSYEETGICHEDQNLTIGWVFMEIK